jgi:hypothetical protein
MSSCMNIVFIAKNYCGATCVTETVRNIFRFLNFFKFSFIVMFPLTYYFLENRHVSDYSFMLSIVLGFQYLLHFLILDRK